MAKPLRSEMTNPASVQFSHFGVLNDGQRSKGAAVTSITINVTLAAIVLILGMVVKNNPVMAKKVADLTLPPQPKVEPPKPKPLPPPPPKVKLPPPPKIEPPRIKMPEPKIQPPPEIKPVVMPKPAPVAIQPPAPKKVDPPPAPRVVSINNMAASIKNNDAHPSAVRMGYTEIAANNNPSALAKVNLGGGMPGMNAGNTGNGPRAASVNLGSGSPGGTNVNSHDRGAVKIAGLGTGVTGGTGRGPAGPVAVGIAPPVAAAPSRPAAEAAHAMATPPVVTYKPQPVYTQEARDMHLEGNVQVKIRVSTAGTVEVLGITRGLGHGLDQAAESVARSMRFKPAMDASGRPVEWTGSVNVTFQMS